MFASNKGHYWRHSVSLSINDLDSQRLGEKEICTHKIQIYITNWFHILIMSNEIVLDLST